jgi:hypothetical protein
MAISLVDEFIKRQALSKYRSDLFLQAPLIQSISYDSDTGKSDEHYIRQTFYDIITNHLVLLEDIVYEEMLDPRYRYNSKYLSYDRYGTIDLWHVILVLNQCRGDAEFNKEKVRLLVPSKVDTYFTRIFLLEGKK